LTIIFEEDYFTTGDIGYKDYKDSLHFRNRAQWIIDYYNFLGISGKVYLLGCAYGYTIKHMIDLGFNGDKVLGIESSTWAFNKTVEVGTHEYVFFCDIDNYNWTTVTDNDLIISWSVLDCITDETKLSSIIKKLNGSGAYQLHVLSVDDSSVNCEDYKSYGYLIKPLSYWQDLFTVTGTILIEFDSALVWRRANPVKWNNIIGTYVPLNLTRVSD